MTTLSEIGDAVVSLLNAGSFPLSFTASRCYVPISKLESLGTVNLQVFVMLARDEIELTSRSDNLEEVTIMVGVVQRFANNLAVDPTLAASNAQIDPLANLMQAFGRFLKPGVKCGNAMWQKTEMKVIFDFEDLKNKNTFVSAVAYTFVNP